MKQFFTVTFYIICIILVKGQGITWQSASSISDIEDYTITDAYYDSASNYTYVTGYYDDSPDMALGQDQVFFVAKYYNSTQVFLETFGDKGVTGKGTFPTAIVGDSNGNIYVAGYFNTDSLIVGDLDTLLNASGGNENMFIAKFDGIGSPIWSFASEGEYGERITDMAIDANDHLIIVGYTNHPSFPFLGYTHANTVVGTDGFLAKLNVDGSRIWSLVDDGNTSAEIHFNHLTLDTSGDIYLTGKFSGTSVPFDYQTTSSQGSYDMFIIKYDKDGSVQWMDNFGSSGGKEEGTAIVTDTSNNVYVAGYYESSFYKGVEYMDNRGGEDILLYKYDAEGVIQWIEKIHSNQDEVLNSLAVSSNDKLVMTGTYKTTLPFGSLDLVASSPVRDQVFVSIYDLDGNEEGVNGYATSASSTPATPTTVLAGAEKSIWLGGNFSGSAIQFGDESSSYTGGQDIFMAYGVLNFTPTLIQLSGTTVPENEVDTLVGKFIVADQDAEDTHTYELIAGAGDTDNSYFTISNDSLFVGGSALNYENDNSLEIRIRVTDAAGAYYDQQFIISVSDNNDTPTGLSLDENHFAEGFAGAITLSADDEDADDSFTFTFATGTGDIDNSSFKIEGDSLLPLEPFDFEAQQTYTIRIQVSDAAGATYDESLNLDAYDAITTYPQISNEEILQSVPGEFEINDFTVDANGELLVIGGASASWNLNDSVMNSGNYVLRVSDSIVALDYNYSGAKDFITAGEIGGDLVYFSSLWRSDFRIQYNEDSIRTDTSFDPNMNPKKGFLDGFGNAIVAYNGGSPSVIKVKKYDLTALDQDYIPVTTIYEEASSNSTYFRDMELDELGNIYLTYYVFNTAVIHLLKMDNNGNVIWDNEYSRASGTGNNYINNIRLDRDRIEAAGSSNDATTIINIGGTLINAQPFYFEVDTSGTTYYTANNSEVLYDVRIGDKFYNPVSDNGTVVLQEIALDKSALTLIEHSTTLTGSVEQFKATPDGELIIRGIRTKQNTISSTETAYVARLDLTGSTLFYKELDEVVYDKGSLTSLWTNKTDRVLLGGWSDEPLTWDNVDIGPGNFILDVNANGVVTNAINTDRGVENIAVTSTSEIYFTDADSLYKLDDLYNQVWSQSITSPSLKLLVDSNDDVYVIQDKIDGDFSQGKVEKFLNDGTVSWSLLSSDSFYTWFFGDAELLEDSLLLLERVNDQINLLIYDEAGNLNRSENFKVGNGSSGVRSIAVSASNEIYLAKDNDYETSSILIMDRFFNQMDSLVTNLHGSIMVDNNGSIFLSKMPAFDASYQFLGPYQKVPTGAYWDFLGDRMITAGGLFYQFLGENQAPEGISLTKLSVPENESNGFVGKFEIDDSDDTSDFIYSIGRWRKNYEYFEYESGAVNFVGFEVRNDSLFTYLSFDHEQDSVELLRVKVTDTKGGHYTQDIEIGIEDVNDPITWITLDTVYLSEALPQGTLISGFEVTDEDANDSFTIELISGEGDNLNEFFEIVDNQLVTSAIELDNEIHHAAGIVSTGTLYGNGFPDSLRIRATDAGGLSLEKYLVVYILDSNEIATEIRFDLTASEENSTLIASLRTDDPEDVLREEQSWIDQYQDAYFYSLVSGEGDDDNGSFYLSGNIELRSSGIPDYESDSVYTVRIRADHDDSEFFLEQAFEIKVVDVNTAPSSISIYADRDKTINANLIDEYVDADVFIGILGAYDQEDPEDDHVFTCNDPNFELKEDSVYTVTYLDLSDMTSAYPLSITVDDQKGGILTYDVGLNINNINNAPTFINMNGVDVINENELLQGNQLVTIDNLPSDDTHTYELVSGEGDTDNEKFMIEGSTLSSTQTFNYEEVTSASIRIRATDSYDEYVEQIFVFSIANVNEAPYGVMIDDTSIPENSDPGTLIGTFSASDYENNLAYFSPGDETGIANDNSHFTFGNSNQLLVKDPLDFETKAEFKIFVIPVDQQGLQGNGAYFTINVTDVADGVEFFTTSIDENTEVGSSAGTLSSPSGTMTYAFASGEGDQDNGLFSISDDQLLVAGTINYEEKNELSILIAGTPTSGGQASTQQFTLAVNDLNEAPFSMNLNGLAIEENQPVGTAIGTLSTEDEDADEQFTYSVIGSDFSIVDDQLVSGRMFDFGTEKSLDITITVTDKGGLTLDQSYSIEIINDPSDDADEVLGMDDHVFTIYPNPATSFLVITGIGPSISTHYEIVDLSGKLIQKGTLNNNRISLDKVLTGTYLLKVSNKDSFATKTLIIK